jgi:hypothetical protein
LTKSPTFVVAVGVAADATTATKRAKAAPNPSISARLIRHYLQIGD